MRRAWLVRANLYRAGLRNACLTRATLYEADLRGAELLGADLQQADLEDAIADLTTWWPEGFDPVAAKVRMVDLAAAICEGAISLALISRASA